MLHQKLSLVICPILPKIAQKINFGFSVLPLSQDIALVIRALIEEQGALEVIFCSADIEMRWKWILEKEYWIRELVLLCEH